MNATKSKMEYVRTSIEEENSLSCFTLKNFYYSEVEEINNLDLSDRNNEDIDNKSINKHQWLKEMIQQERMYTKFVVTSMRNILAMVNQTNLKNYPAIRTPRLTLHGLPSWFPRSTIEFLQKHASASKLLLQRIFSDVSTQWLHFPRFPHYMRKIILGVKKFPRKFLHSFLRKVESPVIAFLFLCLVIPDFTEYTPNRSVILRNTNCITLAITEFQEDISNFGNENVGTSVQPTYIGMGELVPGVQTSHVQKCVEETCCNENVEQSMHIRNNTIQPHRKNWTAHEISTELSRPVDEQNDKEEDNQGAQGVDNIQSHISFNRLRNIIKYPQINAKRTNLDSGIATIPLANADDELAIRVTYKQDGIQERTLKVKRTASVSEILEVLDHFAKNEIVAEDSSFTIYMQNRQDHHFIRLKVSTEIVAGTDILRQPVNNTSRCFAVSSP